MYPSPVESLVFNLLGIVFTLILGIVVGALIGLAIVVIGGG